MLHRLTSATRLEGARVYLRPLGPDDGEHVVRWRSDPVVAGSLFSERPPTRAEHDAWYERYLTTDDRIELVIVVRAEERPIGTIGLQGIDLARREAEYGILVGDAAYRGRGFAHESSALLLDFAFGRLGLASLFLRCFADNVAARRLYERLGFGEDAALAGSRLKDGTRRDTIGMRLTREAWDAARKV